MASSKNKILINMLTFAILQVVNTLVGLFLPRLYLEVYGSEINGVVSTVNSFISYFSYLEAGLGLTLIHSLFKPLAQGDIDERNKLLSFSKKQYKKISYVYFVLVVGMSVIFPLARKAEALGYVEFLLLVFVIGLYGAIDFYTMAKYRVLLTADGKEYVISIAMIIAQFIRFVFVWILLKFNLSVAVVKIVPVITLLVRTIILRLYIKKKYPDADYNVKSVEKKSIARTRIDALLLQISISTSAALPVIIVSQALGFSEANVYATHMLIINALIGLISALSSGVAPALGKKIATKESVDKEYGAYGWIVTLILSFVFSTASILFVPFIRIYTEVVSDINYVYPIYALLFCLWGALYSYRIPLTAIINAAGIYRPNRYNNIISLCFQVVGGIVCTIFWGIVGSLLVMIVVAIHRNISYSYTNSKYLLKNGIKKDLVRQCTMVVLIIASFFLGEYVLKIGTIDLFNWLLYGMVIVIVEFFICLFIFILTDNANAKYSINMIKSKVKGIFNKKRGKENV